jgi:hypothetical protein
MSYMQDKTVGMYFQVDWYLKCHPVAHKQGAEADLVQILLSNPRVVLADYPS